MSELLVGKIGTHETGVQLFADDCQYIAEERMSQTLPLVPTSVRPEYALAVEWLEAGYKYVVQTSQTQHNQNPNVVYSLSATWYGEDAEYTKYLYDMLIDAREQVLFYAMSLT